MQGRFTMRLVTMEDLEAVVELANTAAITDTGKPETCLEEKEAEWNSGDMDIGEDCRIFQDDAGKLLGYIEFWNGAPFTRPGAWGCVHPDYRHLGIGTTLVSWALDRAKSTKDRAATEKQVVFQMFSPLSNPHAIRIFTDHGLSFARRFFRMRIDMDRNLRPEESELPYGLRIRTFRPGIDDKPAYLALQQAFRDHWDHVERPFDTWVQWHLKAPNFDPDVFFLAVENHGENEDIVGACLCFPTFAEEQGCAYIDELGVLKPWRRRGIAIALLRHSFRAFYDRGVYSVQLGVDSESPTGATGLYEKAGMRIARLTDLYEKELRSGKN